MGASVESRACLVYRRCRCSSLRQLRCWPHRRLRIVLQRARARGGGPSRPHKTPAGKQLGQLAAARMSVIGCSKCDQGAAVCWGAAGLACRSRGWSSTCTCTCTARSSWHPPGCALLRSLVSPPAASQQQGWCGCAAFGRRCLMVQRHCGATGVRARPLRRWSARARWGPPLLLMRVLRSCDVARGAGGWWGRR